MIFPTLEIFVKYDFMPKQDDRSMIVKAKYMYAIWIDILKRLIK